MKIAPFSVRPILIAVAGALLLAGRVPLTPAAASGGQGGPAIDAQQSAAARVSQSSGTPEARRFLAEGDAASKGQERAKAIEAYRKAIDADPYFLDAHSKYMASQRSTALDPATGKRNEDTTKAVVAELKQFYAGLAVAQPANAVFQWALGQLDGMDYAAAERHYRRALDIDPGFAQPYQELALIADFRGDNAQEVEYRKKATELNPENPDYAFYYASATKALDRARYRTLSLQVAERFPAHERGAQALYWLAFETPDRDGKIAMLERLRRDFPPDTFSWSSSGMSLLADAYTDSDLDKALALAEAMAHVGASKTAQKEWQQRADFLRSAVDGRALIGKGQASEALARLEAAPALRYANTTVIELLKAEARDTSGDSTKAYEGLVAVVAKEPSDQLNAALKHYAAKLRKTPADVSADLWKVRDAQAKPAPAFTLPDYPDGKPVSLEDYKGKVVLINFWYPTCGPCRGEFPTLQRVLNKYKDRGFTILSPNVLPDEDALVMPYLKNTGYMFRPLKTNTDWAEKTYGARGFPSNHLVDAQGRIVFKPGVIRGPREEHKFELQVEALLERAASTSSSVGR